MTDEEIEKKRNKIENSGNLPAKEDGKIKKFFKKFGIRIAVALGITSLGAGVAAKAIDNSKSKPEPEPKEPSKEEDVNKNNHEISDLEKKIERGKFGKELRDYTNSLGSNLTEKENRDNEVIDDIQQPSTSIQNDYNSRDESIIYSNDDIEHRYDEGFEYTDESWKNIEKAQEEAGLGDTGRIIRENIGEFEVQQDDVKKYSPEDISVPEDMNKNTASTEKATEKETETIEYINEDEDKEVIFGENVDFEKGEDREITAVVGPEGGTIGIVSEEPEEETAVWGEDPDDPYEDKGVIAREDDERY